jgi:hypothetical protein
MNKYAGLLVTPFLPSAVMPAIATLPSLGHHTAV